MCARPSVSEVNLDWLRDLAGHLRDAVRQLRELAAIPRAVFLADSRAKNSAKYLLIVAAEAALDICNHLAARRGGRSPEDYADCMTVLAEIGVIDSDLKARLVRMARFRNRAVSESRPRLIIDPGPPPFRLCGRSRVRPPAQGRGLPILLLTLPLIPLR
jgi:uncharacterized protein YutE (UPF0331/DUF86 family)